MELRTREGRAVLVRPAAGAGGTAAGHEVREVHEVDPDELPLDRGLPEALHEWARVVGAVRDSEDPVELARVGPLVSRRGRQLATRLAVAMGRPVDYVDPFTGEVAPVSPEPSGPPSGAPSGPPPSGRLSVPARHVARVGGGEPTPWGTGLTVSGVTALIVALMMLALTATLSDTSNWLALGAGVVLTGGMAPSVWLLRQVLIWRWVALGVAIGLGVGWAGLPFTLG